MIPSIKTLQRLTGDRERAVKLRAILDGTDPLKTVWAENSWPWSIHHAENKMAAANTLLGTHGVEAVRGTWHDRFWGDSVLLYCNTGDTYAATLCYDTRSSRFLVTSYGDWVEAAERRGEVIP